jgi:hypothetical protein
MELLSKLCDDEAAFDYDVRPLKDDEQPATNPWMSYGGEMPSWLRDAQNSGEYPC